MSLDLQFHEVIISHCHSERSRGICRECDVIFITDPSASLRFAQDDSHYLEAKKFEKKTKAKITTPIKAIPKSKLIIPLHS